MNKIRLSNPASHRSSSVLLTLCLFLGHHCNTVSAIFPCYYLNFLPYLGSYCPVSWSQTKLYSGSTGTNGALSLSWNGNVAAFATDSSTIRIMKRSTLFGSWDQLGDDIEFGNNIRVNGMELNNDGTTMVIGTTNTASSSDKGYVYKFGGAEASALCGLPVVNLFCSWELDERFDDASQMTVSASGDVVAFYNTETTETKAYLRQPILGWTQLGSTITDIVGSGVPSLDFLGTELLLQSSLQAQLYRLDLGPACLVSPDSCTFEKVGDEINPENTIIFISPTRSNMESFLVIDYTLTAFALRTTTTQRYSLSHPSCILGDDSCDWQEDVDFENDVDTEGFVFSLNAGGTVAVGKAYFQDACTLYQNKPLVGWEQVGDALELSTSDFVIGNTVTPWGDGFIAVDLDGDVYFSQLV